MTRTPLGVIALACAAIDDIVAWSLLAVVSAIAGYTDEPLWEVLAYSALFIAVMFGVDQAAARRATWCRSTSGRPAHPGRARVPARRPDLLGLDHRQDRHPLHLRGVRVRRHRPPRGHPGALPGGSGAARAGQRPAAAADLLHRHGPRRSTSPSSPGTASSSCWQCSRSRSAASSWVPTPPAAPRASRTVAPRRWRLLMNTRGLTELVLLSVGLRLGGPRRSALHDAGGDGDRHDAHDGAAAEAGLPRSARGSRGRGSERAALGIPNAYRVLVVLDEAESDAPLVALAADLAASESPSQVVLSMFRPQTTERAGGRQRPVDRARSRWPASWPTSKASPSRCAPVASTAWCSHASAPIPPRTPRPRSPVPTRTWSCSRPLSMSTGRG